jgi:phosphoribosylanthranilate isomerase
MFVKICGITRAEDAKAAVAAGANAIGFVFWPKSPRFIDPYRARDLRALLPPFVTPVGVFVNQPEEYVRGVASLVKLGAVQLHGDEEPAYVGRMTTPVIKAVALGPANGVPVLDIWSRSTTILLDVHDPVRRGGTGNTVDWSAAATIASTRPTLLAGGLTPDNVATAVTRVRPFGIDVSSGVECAPGVKDPARLAALFEALHASRS